MDTEMKREREREREEWKREEEKIFPLVLLSKAPATGEKKIFFRVLMTSPWREEEGFPPGWMVARPHLVIPF